ncbi:MAG: histidinol-phosphate transaminase [Alphaproteobacteria bacterium]|nr:histidinol-phosphate transaminase [Alphaproteobacteria bacterium]
MAPVPRPSVLDITPYKPGSSGTGHAGRVIKLSSNETPLGASPKAIAAARAAADDLSRYPEPGATPLREAIADRYGLRPDRIVCGNGSDELLGLLAVAYADADDEILYSRHGFLMYPIAARIAGAVPVTAPETDLTVDVDALLAAATPRTRVCFIANPNNPTGTAVGLADLRRLRAGLPDTCLLVVDSAYAEYVEMEGYDDARRLVDEGANVVMTRTFSKIFGLAGLRLGWAYGPASVIDVLHRVRGPFNVNGVAQAAGMAAIRDREFLARAQDHNRRWRPWLEVALRELGLGVRPGVANFVLAEFDPAGPKSAAAAYDHLVGQGIFGRRVGEYGLPDHLRFTVGLEEENRAVAAALADFLT